MAEFYIIKFCRLTKLIAVSQKWPTNILKPLLFIQVITEICSQNTIFQFLGCSWSFCCISQFCNVLTILENVVSLENTAPISHRITLNLNAIAFFCHAYSFNTNSTSKKIAKTMISIHSEIVKNVLLYKCYQA